MLWQADMLLVTPTLRFSVRMAFDGAGGEFWPVWNVHRHRRQVSLAGLPLDPWYHDGVVDKAATRAVARMAAETAASE